MFVRDERRFGFVRADFGFVAVDEQALYEVFEFADVARVPVVLAQEVLGGEAEVAVGQLFVVSILLAVVVEQFGDSSLCCSSGAMPMVAMVMWS